MMGEHANAVKKKNEDACLEEVIQIGKKQHGETKAILSFLSACKDCGEEDQERPDFLRKHFAACRSKRRYTNNVNKKCRFTGNDDEDLIVGIEHFRVDHLSIKKKKGNIASTGIATEHELNRIHNQHRREVVEDGIISNELIEDLNQLIANQLKEFGRRTYNNFLDAFEYSLNKHVKSVDVYRENLRRKAESENSLYCLGFLIEIHSEFRNLFLTDSRGTRKKTDGLMPMFADVIRMIEHKVNKNKVDFIIFYLCETLAGNNSKVVAVRTDDIIRRLEKQQYKVYEYAGRDALLGNFQAMTDNTKVETRYEKNSDSTTTYFSVQQDVINEDQYLDFLYFSFYKAWYCEKKGCNVITTLDVQYMWETIGDRIISWNQPSKEEDSWKIKPVFIPLEQEEINKRMTEFEKKYHLEKVKDEDND